MVDRKGGRLAGRGTTSHLIREAGRQGRRRAVMQGGREAHKQVKRYAGYGYEKGPRIPVLGHGKRQTRGEQGGMTGSGW